MNIVITGASSGIGFELATIFKDKHKVIVVARREDKLNRLSENEENLPIIVVGDITKVDCIERIANEAKRLGRIDVLINNAGVLLNKPFVKTTSQDLHEVFETNVFSVFSLTQALLPYLQKSDQAHVVNISGMGGFQGTQKFPGLSAYSPSKAALINLTECMSVEFQNMNIVVNCLSLGAVQTEMLSTAFPDYQAPLSGNEMATYIAEFALTGKKFFNGQVLPVSLSTP